MDFQEPVTRDSVLKLMERKEEIEKKLMRLKQILDRNGVGMKDSLVDSNGYPRQDIDVYEVRHARHDFICLRNDHKAIMQEIAKGLNVLHSQRSHTVEQASCATVKRKENIDHPIAKVSFVEPGSPADLAGLHVDDFIISYGTVNFDNFKSLLEIGEVTQHSIGREIPVTVRRNGVLEKLKLTPNEWSGKGLLGCNLMLLEHVEK